MTLYMIYDMYARTIFSNHMVTKDPLDFKGELGLIPKNGVLFG